MIIRNKCRVTVDYIMKDAKGRVIESSETQGFLEYVHGADEIPDGLEQALEGCEPGKNIHVRIPPEKAYGHKQSSLIKTVPKSVFRRFGEPKVGLRFKAEFEGTERLGVITGKKGRMLTVDVNHPLAGKVLDFDLKVKTVESA